MEIAKLIHMRKFQMRAHASVTYIAGDANAHDKRIVQ